MIEEKIVREEKFQGANSSLLYTLAQIPMTEQQRNLIRRDIDFMEEIFRKANSPS